jgi:hypothetical protein
VPVARVRVTQRQRGQLVEVVNQAIADYVLLDFNRKIE